MAQRTRVGRREMRRSPGAGAAFVSREAFCVISGVSPRELAAWEHENLIAPARVVEHDGRREPLYDGAALRRARLIRTLAEELEVNLPGIEIILNLLDQIER
jgi:chaperone modulatory protein CbpM